MNEEKLQDLLRDLPTWVPTEDRRAVLRGATVAHATNVPTPVSTGRSHRAWVSALAAGLLIGFVAHGLSSEPEVASEPGGLGTFAAVGEATFAHELVIEADARDEQIRLEDGEVTFSVRKLGRADRFRVILKDAEVEVRGTRFTVSARDGLLMGVDVQEGLVEVRTESEGTRLLAAGQSFRTKALALARTEVLIAPPEAEGVTCPPAPTEPPTRQTTPSACVCPAPRAETPTPVALSPAPEPTALEESPLTEVPTATRAARRDYELAIERPDERAAPDVELAFAESWRHFQDGRFRAAAEGFTRVRVSSSDRGLASDALYFEVMALRRLDDLEAAAATLERVLRTPEKEARADELRLLYASTLFELGRKAQADRWLTEAEASTIPSVRREARILREATR